MGKWLGLKESDRDSAGEEHRGNVSSRDGGGDCARVVWRAGALVISRFAADEGVRVS